MSRLQNWEDHVEYRNDSEVVAAIKRSYYPDLTDIKNTSRKISDAIEGRDWLKRKLEKHHSLRMFIRGVANVLSLVSSIFGILGIPNGLNGLACRNRQSLLERSE